jgi:hypothetical protein
LEDIFKGGSGTGHSYWKKWHGCQRAALLDEQSPPNTEGNFVMQVGSVFHALAEMQERTQRHLDTTKILPFSQRPSDPIVEGARVFRQYRTMCPPGFWGTPMLVEEVLGKSDEDRAVVSQLFEGFRETCTIKPDMIINVDSLAAQRIKSKFKLSVKPGNYLLDYKTVAGIPTDTDSYFHSIQFKLYQLVWNALRPDKLLSGALCTFISRAKDVRVVPILIPAVTEVDRKIVSAFLREALHRKDEAHNLSEAPVNNTYCHKCPHFTNFTCERY